MHQEYSRSGGGDNDKLDDALSLLEEIDKHRHLHKWAAVILFCVTGALAVYSFFWLIDLTEWLGFSSLDPLLSVAVSYTLLFVVWVFLFLVVLSVLNTSRVNDLHALVKSQLAELQLTPSESAELQRRIALKDWRHGDLLQSALADLSSPALGKE